MTTTWKIYALVDPQSGEPRYIGQTRFSLEARFKGHLNDKKPSYKVNWLKNLKSQGLRPVIRELYKCYDGTTADVAEIFFIANFKERGFRLTNLSLGGSNVTNVQSEETKAKIRKKALGNKRWLGKTHSAESRAKISKAYKTWNNLSKEQQAVKVAKLKSGAAAYRKSLTREDKQQAFRHLMAGWRSWLDQMSDEEKARRDNILRVRASSANKKAVESYYKLTEDARKERAAKLTEATAAWRKALTPEERALISKKISEARKGSKLSPESLAKRRAKLKAKRAARQLELKQCQPDNQTDG